MEIISLNFALFVVQLAFCIVPIAVGLRLFTLSSEKKEQFRQSFSKRLLGDPSLINIRFFSNTLYLIAFLSSLFGLAVACYIIFVIMPK